MTLSKALLLERFFEPLYRTTARFSRLVYNFSLKVIHKLAIENLPYDIASLSAYTVLAALCLGLLLTMFFNRSSRHSSCKIQRMQQTRMALRALLVLLTPTCSLWSPIYVSVARRATSSQKRVIDLPLRVLLEDLISGAVEFRDIRLDLPDLLSGTLCLDSWTVRLVVEWSWWGEILKWTLASQATAYDHSVRTVIQIKV